MVWWYTGPRKVFLGTKCPRKAAVVGKRNGTHKSRHVFGGLGIHWDSQVPSVF